MEKLEFPCDGCDYRSSCRAACARLHKFLREDPKCHTRVRMTELVLDPKQIEHLSGYAQFDSRRVPWQELAGTAPDVEGISKLVYLLEDERALLMAFYAKGLSYKQIANSYRISTGTVKRILKRAKDKLKDRFPEIQAAKRFARYKITQQSNGRNAPGDSEWRAAIFKRDDYTCQKCKAQDKPLNAHHILSYADNPNIRHDPDNGITFCEKCHKAFHFQYGFRTCTRKQLLCFL